MMSYLFSIGPCAAPEVLPRCVKRKRRFVAGWRGGSSALSSFLLRGSL